MSSNSYNLPEGKGFFISGITNAIWTGGFSGTTLECKEKLTDWKWLEKIVTELTVGCIPRLKLSILVKLAKYSLWISTVGGSEMCEFSIRRVRGFVFRLPLRAHGSRGQLKYVTRSICTENSPSYCVWRLQLSFCIHCIEISSKHSPC